jgi:hypothetical protein
MSDSLEDNDDEEEEEDKEEGFGSDIRGQYLKWKS